MNGQSADDAVRERVARLEAEVGALRGEVAALRVASLQAATAQAAGARAAG